MNGGCLAFGFSWNAYFVSVFTLIDALMLTQVLQVVCISFSPVEHQNQVDDFRFHPF